MQKDLQKFEEAKIQVVALSYDYVADLKEFSQQQKITFPLLSDETSKVIDAYRVRNKDVRTGSQQEGIPHPATFIVDSKGLIRAKLPGTVPRRHTTDALLKAIADVRKADQQQKKKQ